MPSNFILHRMSRFGMMVGNKYVSNVILFHLGSFVCLHGLAALVQSCSLIPRPPACDVQNLHVNQVRPQTPGGGPM